MSEHQSKWVAAIIKLIKYTQEGRLKWVPGKIDGEASLDDQKIEIVFVTVYKDKTLRLYKYSYKVEDLSPINFLLFEKKQKIPYWDSAIALELIDKEGKTLWTFPNNNALKDLLEAVRYQVAGVDDFLDEILCE